MAEPLGRVLAVGCTGMLADAVRTIAPRAAALTLAARDPGPLASETGARPLALDWSDRDGAIAALAGLPADHDLAIVWLHDDAVWAARPCEDRVRPGGRLIRVHGALSADPAVRARREPDPRRGLARQIVVLGWHPDPAAAEGKRWLTHTEICAATLRAVDTPGTAEILAGTRAGP